MSSVVLIVAVSSDIGAALAARYLARGWRVIGTHRPGRACSDLRSLGDIELIPCDVADPVSIAATARSFSGRGTQWDMLISAVGDLTPIGQINELDPPAWGRSVHVNGAGQLQLLQSMLPFGSDRLKRVAFLVGGGINGPFPNFSAYCLGKLLLVKACELIHDELDDVHAVAIGTGWVDTKIHEQTIAAGSRAGANLERTLEFVRDPARGTTIADIHACLDWCFDQEREVTGGRNISVVHDAWREGSRLAAELRSDPSLYKLRRSGS